jgi:asparagine synthase (glutamine-hydrolysing)
VSDSIAGDDHLHSFSIGFHEKQISESRYQQLIVDYVHSIHHEIIFDWVEIAQRLQEMIYHCECPVKETYNTCSMALAEAARDAGITVILTGEGADELFAGYVGYRFDRSRLRSNVTSRFGLFSSLEQDLREQVWGDGEFFYEHDLQDLAEIKGVLYSAKVMESITTSIVFGDLSSTKHA